MAPVSTMTVGAGTVGVLDDSLVEQTRIRRQIGTSAANGADQVHRRESAQLGGGAPPLSLSAFAMSSRTRDDRLTLRRRASLESTACNSPGNLTERPFMK